MSKKAVYGKYEIKFSAFCYVNTGMPSVWKTAVRENLREAGYFLVEPSFKIKLFVEMDKPTKKNKKELK